MLVHKLPMLVPMFMCVNSEDHAVCAYTNLIPSCVTSVDRALYRDCFKIMMPILRLINFLALAIQDIAPLQYSLTAPGIQPITFPKATEYHTEVKVT